MVIRPQFEFFKCEKKERKKISLYVVKREKKHLETRVQFDKWSFERPVNGDMNWVELS